LWTSILGIISLVSVLIVPGQVIVWGLIFIVGLAVANIFPLVFSLTIERFPERTNEISGLMIMAVSGGAIIPPVIGWVSDMTSIAMGMSVLVVSMIYLLVVSLFCLKKS
jgi:fucose permease